MTQYSRLGRMLAARPPVTPGMRTSTSSLLVPAVVVVALAAFALGGIAVSVFHDHRGERDAHGAGLTIAEVYAKAADGVVRVGVAQGADRETYSGGPGRDVLQPSGSGFVYDADGRIVTNRHVVLGAAAVRIRLAGDRVLPARLVADDPDTDIAVLQIDAPASGMLVLSLADSSRVVVGDAVVAIGSPFGMDRSVTTGIVSAVGRTITSPDASPITGVIQTDAAINHGNSGGPLLDMNGNVIGLVAQFMSASGGSNGVGLAIPSSTVETVVARLLAHPQRQVAVVGAVSEGCSTPGRC